MVPLKSLTTIKLAFLINNDHQISAFHITLNHQDVYFCQKQRKSKGKVP